MFILTSYIIKDKMMFMVGEYRKSKLCTRVVEIRRSFLVSKSPEEIMEDTLNYYGFDLRGALQAAGKLLGSPRMCPVIINPNNAVCLFPTKSPLKDNCYFFSIQHVKDFESEDKETKVLWSNGSTIIIPTNKRHFLRKKTNAETLRQTILERNDDLYIDSSILNPLHF